MKDSFSNEEIIKTYNTIFEAVNNFDINKGYEDIYTEFKNSVGFQFLYCFHNILDATARKIIDEIYQNLDNTNDIIISFDPIAKASSNNRKHFEVAKTIAEKTIKIYYFEKDSGKTIISYIDDYIPKQYTKCKEINKVVWYFLVCITSFNQKVCKKQ